MVLLLLMGLGAAGVKAQVRIGGNGAPNAAAVLDLNATDATTGTKGLALPRVSLTSTTDKLGQTTLPDGMLVYNTNASITGGSGIYVWKGTGWALLASRPNNMFVNSTIILDTVVFLPTVPTGSWGFYYTDNRVTGDDLCTTTMGTFVARTAGFGIFYVWPGGYFARVKCYRLTE